MTERVLPPPHRAVKKPKVNGGQGLFKLCGLTEKGSASEENNFRLGFTCKGSTERLLEQLDEAQQGEVFDMISAYCLERGITYSRIDAQKRRDKLMDDILSSLGELSGKKVG